MARRKSEDPALIVLLMQQICQRENLRRVLQRVRQNKGGPGSSSDSRCPGNRESNN